MTAPGMFLPFHPGRELFDRVETAPTSRVADLDFDRLIEPEFPEWGGGSSVDGIDRVVVPERIWSWATLISVSKE